MLYRTARYLSFGHMAQCVVHARKGLAPRARVTPASYLPRTGGTASSAQRSRRLRSTRVAAPGLLAHAYVTILRSAYETMLSLLVL